MVFRKEPSVTEKIQLPYQSSKNVEGLIDPLSSLNKTYKLERIISASTNLLFYFVLTT